MNSLYRNLKIHFSHLQNHQDKTVIKKISILTIKGEDNFHRKGIIPNSKCITIIMDANSSRHFNPVLSNIFKGVKRLQKIWSITNTDTKMVSKIGKAPKIKIIWPKFLHRVATAVLPCLAVAETSKVELVIIWAEISIKSPKTRTEKNI